ncbi:MAG TPA: YgiQ family radical SAM protein [Deltaproteobacteria bacterium]|nr:YgiQ family radical SAM protein [Deltaproteobacteria bacterium]HPP80304.1 YgiQ family radical SAM protein [Deltaproteobacteria bacterium]
MFLPETPEEMKALGWDALDVILVTGDAYIDSPHIGVALVGKTLVDAGFRVGVIAQPDTSSGTDILRLGEPRLFWGVTAGSVDSMVANYTPLKKRRRSDDYTPGGLNTKRPDRATIVYSNLIRRFSSSGAPIVLGGIEASLRRVAHYDYWSDSIRRSVLFDAKADALVYGMGEYTALEIARRLASGLDISQTAGTCTISKTRPEGATELPPFELVQDDKEAFTDMFLAFSELGRPGSKTTLCQRHGDRFLVHNPPPSAPTTSGLDRVYGLGYEREVHPRDRLLGEVRAIETIRFSITTHRGCAGRCSFCSISVHEGPVVVSRSQASILEEASGMTRHPLFKGIIQDVGGPTANMYGMGCKKGAIGGCTARRCLYPEPCPALRFGHGAQIELLRRLRRIEGVRKVFVASGIRHDLVVADEGNGMRYLEELAAHHVSGQLKLAPEHCRKEVLRLMAKPGTLHLLEFRDRFRALSEKAHKRQFLTYYFLAAHPGCTREDMEALRAYTESKLFLVPEQVQIFTPTPSTLSTLMYYTRRDPFSGAEIFVERDARRKRVQKDILTSKGGQPDRAAGSRKRPRGG